MKVENGEFEGEKRVKNTPVVPWYRRNEKEECNENISFPTQHAGRRFHSDPSPQRAEKGAGRCKSRRGTF